MTRNVLLQKIFYHDFLGICFRHSEQFNVITNHLDSLWSLISSGDFFYFNKLLRNFPSTIIQLN